MPFLFSISIFDFLFDALKFRALYSHLEEWAGRGGGVSGCGAGWEVGVGSRGGKSGWEACVGCAWGVRGACVGVRKACVFGKSRYRSLRFIIRIPW